MLKYLFVAEFEDGSLIEQTQEDFSKLDPTKNQMHDVRNHSAELVRFTLCNQEKCRGPISMIVSLDLRDGTFKVNGFPFMVQTKSDDLPITTKRKIVYSRTNKLTWNGVACVDGEFDVNGIEPFKQTTYHLGWEEESGKVQYIVSFE